MEGRKRSGKCGGGTTCIPRRRGRRRASPESLLDRFRDVVFRMVMMSTASKRAAAQLQERSTPPHRGGGRAYRSDSYRSEAVEDCIEFFKRSASGMESAKGAGGEAVEVDFRSYQWCEA